MNNNLQSPKIILERMKKYQDFFKDKLKEETNPEEIEYIKDDIKCLDDYLDISARYLSRVVNFQKQKTIMKKTISDNEDFKKEWENFDRGRSKIHTGCVINLAILDRICKNNDLEPIYGNFGEYLKDTKDLTKNKSEMSSEDKQLRRNIGNFSLYFAGYYTLGVFLDNDRELEDYIIKEGSTDSKQILQDIENAASKIKKPLNKFLHEVTEVDSDLVEDCR